MRPRDDARQLRTVERSILDMAIALESKSFISHSYCQAVIDELWMGRSAQCGMVKLRKREGMQLSPPTQCTAPSGFWESTKMGPSAQCTTQLAAAPSWETAMPTSAIFKDAQSFIPSPTIHSLLPSFSKGSLSDAMCSTLSFGLRSQLTFASLIPTLPATTFQECSLSPVNM